MSFLCCAIPPVAAGCDLGAGRIVQLAELLLPEHGSEQGTHWQLQHLLTGNRARCSDAISILSLAKIPTPISAIKLKSWVSCSQFSGDSQCCLSSLYTSCPKSSLNSSGYELQSLFCKHTVNNLLKTLLKNISCGERGTNLEKSALP